MEENNQIKVEDKELNKLISKCLAEEFEKERLKDTETNNQQKFQVSKKINKSMNENCIDEQNSKTTEKNKSSRKSKYIEKDENFKFSWLKFTLFFIFSFGIGALLYGLYAITQKKINN